MSSNGRIFKMVLNAADPTVVDSFSILVDASAISMRNPDNVAVSHDGVIVQEDTSNAKVWMYSLPSGPWIRLLPPISPQRRQAASLTSRPGSATAGGRWTSSRTRIRP